MKLSYKIYILFAVASLFTVLSVFGVTYYLTRTILVSGQYAAYARLAEISAKRIDYFLSEKLSSAKVLATRPIVYEALGGASSARLSQIRENLQESEAADQHIYGIYIIDRNKNVVVSTDKNPTAGKVPDLSVQEEILRKIFSGETAYSDLFISENTGQPAMIFAAPVFDGRKNVLGAAEVYITWSEVLNILKDINVTFVHLINSKGLEIGSNIPEHYGNILKEDYSNKPAYQKFFADIQERTAQVSIEKDLHTNSEVVSARTHLFGSYDYKGNGWMLVLEEPVDAVLGPINRSVANISVYTLLARLLFLSALLWLLKKYLLNPVTAYSDISRRIVAGEKDLRIPESRKDELGMLAREFNSMVDKLQKSNEDLEIKVAEKTRQLQDEVLEKELKNKILEDAKKSTLNLLEDISLERAKADALVNELNKFQLTVDNSYEHIIFTDPQGIVIYANKAAEKITGYSRGEMIGQKPSLWGNQMSRKFYKEMWNTIKAERRTFIGEMKNKRKNGQFYMAESNIFPIIGKDGEIKFFVGIERDVTEERKLDEARVNFIAIASHQLRTPITSIKWIAELLLSGDLGILNKEQADLVGDLSVSARRMIQLVNSLLNIARIESEDLNVNSEAVNLRKVYDSIVREFEVSAKSKKLKFTFINETGMSDFKSDYNLFYEILKNLLSNSIKYTLEGGSIETRLSVKGDSIICAVKDTGIGIPKNQQDQIFSKLFRADNAVKVSTDGTGLGMYIIKNLADLLGGKVWFESEENKGTTVYVSLPLSGPLAHEGSRGIIDVR